MNFVSFYNIAICERALICHTIRKVTFWSKKSILTKLYNFLGTSKLSITKKCKSSTFSRVLFIFVADAMVMSIASLGPILRTFPHRWIPALPQSSIWRPNSTAVNVRNLISLQAIRGLLPLLLLLPVSQLMQIPLRNVPTFILFMVILV